MKVDDDGQVQLNIVEKDDMEEVRLQSTEMKPETLLQKIRATKRKVKRVLVGSKPNVLNISCMPDSSFPAT